MNKKMFRSVSLYSLLVVIAVIALTVSAVILSVSKPAGKQPQTLTTSSASDLKVKNATSSAAPSVSTGGSGNASSSGTVTLQAGQAAPVPAGTTYPCANCPDATSTTEVMICSDYCANPAPTPAPSANPYPQQCDTCRGNTTGASDGTMMCSMIACRYVE